jgi:hypothetical protein
MDKKKLDAIAGGTGIFGATLWLGPSLYHFVIKLFNGVDVGMTVEDSFELVKNTPLNWRLIGLYVVLLTISTLMVFHYDDWKKWRRSKVKTYDVTLADAIRYIASGSTFSYTIQGNSSEDDLKDVVNDAILSSAREGRITVKGRKIGETEISTVPVKAWRSDVRLGIDSAESLNLYSKELDKILYKGLMVEGKEIVATWKPNPGFLEVRWNQYITR